MPYYAHFPQTKVVYMQCYSLKRYVLSMYLCGVYVLIDFFFLFLS